ncbi:topology modulation protein [Actinoplanes sp. NPDC048988]|uniref:topology modulation protein n=1 Tax=Actinoplanes sp. NPDC048988 TaxID=3363901 RepID=UPI00371DF162
MERVAVLGASGAGKTVLARTLGALLDLPVTHLDQLRYDADWNVVPEPEFVAAQRQLVAGSHWIADGNSLASLPIRAAAADTIIVLDPHPLVCLAGIAVRRLRYRGGQHADGVYDRITIDVLRYVATYRVRHLPRVHDCLREHAPGATVVHLRSRRAVARYVTAIRADAGRQR